jgi:hypothetical protein
MTMTADGWAERVIYGLDEVSAALEHLESLGLVQSQTAGAIVYYRLTQDEIRLGQLNRFIHWRDGWLIRVHRVEQLVGPAKLNMSILGRM